MSDTTKLGKTEIDGLVHVRIYHVRERLSTQKLPILGKSADEVQGILFIQEQRAMRSNLEMVAAGMRGEGNANELTKIEEVHPITQLIREIPGLEYVVPFAYNLVIVKAKMYDWADVEPALLRIIRMYEAPLPAYPTKEELNGTS